MIDDIRLDHVAVATERMADAWPRYAGDLAGTWLGGGATYGFASAQVVYANGMKVEVLEPYLVEQNDFLRRFLDRNGPGPHHLTYKVGDIVSALEQVEAAGYRPVNVDLSDPHWKEAFIHPKDAPGVVVQLAQSSGGDSDDWRSPQPADFPAPRLDEPATLVHVAHAVADLDEGLRLFRDLLAGEVATDGNDFVDLVWPGPGRVRLVTSLADWVGDRAGRIHHIAFEVPCEDDLREVSPEDNLGTRLLLTGDAQRFSDHALG